MITTNTGAKKLEASDNWREIFPNPTLSTAGAHNASVDAADRIQPEIAPIINGKQCALGAASGDYVLLRNSTITGKSDGAYIAAKAIPAATDIDATYLGNAITGGISNSLNNNLANIKIYKSESISTISVANETLTTVKQITSIPAGTYILFCKIDFASTSATGYRAVSLSKNDGNADGIVNINGVNGSWTRPCFAWPVSSSSTFKIAIKVEQSSGSAMNVGGYYHLVRIK